MLILSFILPLPLVYLLTQLYTVEELGGAVGGGLLLGFIVVWLMVFPTIARMVTKHITMPYNLRNNTKFRWSLGVVYQDEFPSYSAYNKRNDVYILLDRRTDSIINTDVQPPKEKRSTRVICIIVPLLFIGFFLLGADGMKDDSDISFLVAALLVSITAFVLAIFRTIKPEY